ncbi:hypothetical protein DV735_g356, partial [Chaetothyriales sp. CBS 134920]
MATTAEILPYLDHLEDNLDGLEESLNAFLPGESVAATAKALPLIDRAKLHVTVAYAIESLIFSYLRLHNLSPHSHPVFKELARVKSYFDKIKEIENARSEAAGGGSKKPDAAIALDKLAAERVIKHALAGNRKIDLEAAEKKAREALLAKRRLKMMTKSVEQTATSTEAVAAAKPPTNEDSAIPAFPITPPSSSRPVHSAEEEEEEADAPQQQQRGDMEEEIEANGNGGNGGVGETPRRAKKKRKHSSVAAGTDGGD